MLHRWIRSSRARRASRRREAHAPIAVHGEAGWYITRARAFACGTGTRESDEAWKVGCPIHRKLKINRMPDTVTRFLQG